MNYKYLIAFFAFLVACIIFGKRMRNWGNKTPKNDTDKIKCVSVFILIITDLNQY